MFKLAKKEQISIEKTVESKIEIPEDLAKELNQVPKEDLQLIFSRMLRMKLPVLFKEKIRRKGFSYTDATTILAMKQYKLGFLLSFDQRTFQGLVPKIIGQKYWASLPEEERGKMLKLAQNYLPRLK